MMSIEEEFNEAIQAAEEYEWETLSFRINNDSKASWALKILKSEAEETDRLIAIADAQIAELEEKKKKLEDQRERKSGYLKMLLSQYFDTVPHKETKTQESYKLLDGSLVWKKPTQKMVPDRDKLLAYVKANNMPEFVKVKEEVDWAAYKKECEISDGRAVNVQTGELLPEDVITIEEEPGSFTVKVG